MITHQWTSQKIIGTPAATLVPEQVLPALSGGFFRRVFVALCRAFSCGQSANDVRQLAASVALVRGADLPGVASAAFQALRTTHALFETEVVALREQVARSLLQQGACWLILQNSFDATGAEKDLFDAVKEEASALAAQHGLKDEELEFFTQLPNQAAVRDLKTVARESLVGRTRHIQAQAAKKKAREERKAESKAKAFDRRLEVGSGRSVKEAREVPPSAPVVAGSLGPQAANQTCYFELDQFPIWDITNWQTTPPTIDEQALATYFSTLAAQLSACGVTNVALNFAQVQNIPLLTGKTPWNPVYKGDDSIGMMYESAGGIQQDVVKLITQALQKANMGVTLAFGGGAAGYDDWTLTSANAVAYANELAAYAIKMGFKELDFDVEMLTNNPDPITAAFYSTLKKALAGSEVKVDFTIMGGFSNIPNIYSIFFANNPATGHANFLDWFDNVRLMLYSDSMFYVDADNDSWGLKQWVANYVGPENAGRLQVGFTDLVAYDEASCGSGAAGWANYGIQNGTPAGTAAAQVFTSVTGQLGQALGPNFWWPDTGKNSYSGPNFGSATMKQFAAYQPPA